MRTHGKNTKVKEIFQIKHFFTISLKQDLLVCVENRLIKYIVLNLSDINDPCSKQKKTSNQTSKNYTVTKLNVQC